MYGHQNRRFHTVESISNAVKKAGFKIESIEEFNERLCKDWERKIIGDADSTIIQLVLTK